MESLTRVLLIILLILLPTAVFAKGFSSSGFRSSGSSFSSHSYTAPKTYSAPKTYTAPKGYTAPKTSTSSTGFTAPTFRSSTATVSKSYRPTFSGGYSPPVGSHVSYSGFSWGDLLFWSYLMNHNGQQTAVVTQPDGKKVATHTSNPDWMYWLDWLIVILLGIGLIVLVVWLVNKYTKGKPKYAAV